MMLDQQLVQDALPNYEMEGELGRGGWGVVLGGRHRGLGRDVAIKQLPRAFAADPNVRARFLAEARVLASLDHPHVVPVFDFVEREGVCLLVMEKLSGGTLWTRFLEQGVTMDDACAVVLATCSALQCAHERGVLHRDIKPENLMFTGSGTLKVTDFGIAKVVGGEETMATRAGEVLGTPAYMAPEQAQGAELSAATDVYAVGTMLYELLSGQLPYADDGDALQLLYRHVYEPPTPLLEVAPTVPPALAEVVMRSLVADPAERYPTALAFGQAVAEAATASWGPGWLGGSQVTVLAANPMMAPTVAPNMAVAEAPVVTAPDNAVPSVTVAPTQAVPESANGNGANGRATVAPASAPVRPSVSLAALHRPAPVDVDRESIELVPVQEAVPKPSPPTVQVAVAVALLLLALALAFVGIGTPSRTGNLQAGSVTVNGRDPVSPGTADLDLSEPIAVAGTVAGVDKVALAFKVGELTIGTKSATATPGAGGFNASVDASGLRYLAPGLVTGEVKLTGGGADKGAQEFAVETAQSPFLSLPGAVGIGLALFVLAYAESLLKSMRRGRRKVTGPIGLTIIGALGGLAAVIISWLAGAAEPTRPTVLVCALLGAGAGLAGAMAAIRVSQRRRYKVRS